MAIYFNVVFQEQNLKLVTVNIYYFLRAILIKKSRQNMRDFKQKRKFQK